MSDVQPTPVTCRKCGALAGPPIYNEDEYNSRPALFWACLRTKQCGYTWTQLIYREPEVEVAALRERIKDLERAP